MDTIAPSVLIESSPNLQIMRTYIKSWMCSISDQIRLLAPELHTREPCERRKFDLFKADFYKACR